MRAYNETDEKVNEIESERCTQILAPQDTQTHQTMEIWYGYTGITNTTARYHTHGMENDVKNKTNSFNSIYQHVYLLPLIFERSLERILCTVYLQESYVFIYV